MILNMVSKDFWNGKRVFITGHTGFKGGWLSLWLTLLGAKVTGYSLSPTTERNFFNVLKINNLIHESHFANIGDFLNLKKSMQKAAPDILIHMAAQSLVINSYANPLETYATNVMGTVHVLEAAREVPSLRSTVVVTTDKCYENKEWIWGYRENEPMGGCDPYSSSKGCAELVTSAYRKSFFSHQTNQNYIATARAGNVIGGGDYSLNRLIPDAIKSFDKNSPIFIRNPLATRPWQHVLEPLSGYLILAQALFDDGYNYASSWNFGPHDEGNRTVKDVIELLISKWGNDAQWVNDNSEKPHEAQLLRLDCTKANTQLEWYPKWNLDETIQKIVEWHKAFRNNEDMYIVSLSQINQYMDY
jgi:CDP-glucose 4,6-dehydratase